jgi:hypothetical protein
MDPRIVDEVADALEMERSEVSPVIDEFLLQLHKRALEYKGLNGDFIGENLHYEIGEQGFYHLLGFLAYFANRYVWNEGSSSEYLRRLGGSRRWSSYCHQMEGWNVVRNSGEDRID